MSSDGTTSGIDDPPYHAGKVEGLGDSLLGTESCMPHHIAGMAGEQLNT